MNQKLENVIYGDWPLHYNPLLPEKQSYDAKEYLGTGIFFQDNGDILFRLYAPGSQRVSIQFKVTIPGIQELELQKDPDGIFEGVFPYNEDFLGPHSFDVVFDGTILIYPYYPISWHRSRPTNYLDVPDPETSYIHVRSVPHGAVSREIFYSSVMGRWERCLVYTPPGYMNNQEYYPVLYLQHGATENEVVWEYNGRVSSIMDNLIADHKATPCLIVMNDGMVAYQKNEMGTAFGDMLIRDCIPFIDEHYRTRRDRESRAIAGLSMGSVQASAYGLGHPELFAYIGLFSGFIRCLMPMPCGEEYLESLKDAGTFAKNYKVFFRSIGDCDRGGAGMPNLLQLFQEEDELCGNIDHLGNYYRVMYKNQYHEFGAWRRAIYDFAQLIFKEKR